MSDADRIRVRHMLDAASEAMAFAKGRSPQALQGNRMLLIAVVKVATPAS
jgi:uncharacterized protein with HEPN domain